MNLITPHKPTTPTRIRNFPTLTPNEIPLSHTTLHSSSVKPTPPTTTTICVAPPSHRWSTTHVHTACMVGTQCAQVTDMTGMFLRASSFNGDLSKWDVSNVSGERGRGGRGGSSGEGGSKWAERELNTPSCHISHSHNNTPPRLPTTSNKPHDFKIVVTPLLPTNNTSVSVAPDTH